MPAKDKNLRKEWGRELRRRRVAAGIAPDSFADALGLTQKTLQQVELGYQNLGQAAKKKAEEILSRGSVPSSSSDKAQPADTGAVAVIVAEMITDPTITDQASGIQELLGCSRAEAVRIVVEYRLRAAKTK